MFDETFIHHAANRTQQQRVVLFCDIERPLWTAPVRWFNRVFAKYVLAAAASANDEGESIGGLNQFFKVFYQGRLRAKAFKAKHRTAYYVLKWAAILGLLWLLFW
jgi:beta-hydroxylase